MLQPLSQRFTIKAMTLPSEENPAMEFNGEQYAFQFNADEQMTFIINPNDRMQMGHPKLDKRYPLLVTYSGGHPTYHRDALVTKTYSPNSDSYDVSIMTLLGDATVTALPTTPRRTDQQTAQPESGTSDVASLFPSPES